jgi:hypothetical protein
MFFTDFNPMTEEEITKKVSAKPKADGSAGGRICPVPAGVQNP